MKKLSIIFLSTLIGFCDFIIAQNRNFSPDLKQTDVTTVCNAVADWQVANHQASRHSPLDWTNGALYRGVVEWGKMTGNEHYFNFIDSIGNANRWGLLNRRYHADDICVAQAFIEMYRIYNRTAMLQPSMERAYWVANHPSEAPLAKNDRIGANERWSWSDALFMAPPVYAALYKLTGERIYLDYMEREFKACTDSLYDRTERLYYRDNTKIPLREANGAKQFWGRGNGWVYGGLALILDYLPDDYNGRSYYIELFKELTESVLRTQDMNGAWHASLHDSDSYPTPENSCSAFFCYGLAWGLNRGYIKGKIYEEALRKGWASLVGGVHADGKLGFVQPIGEDPRDTNFDTTDVYGVGAFLLAGSEIYIMCGGKPNIVNR